MSLKHKINCTVIPLLCVAFAYADALATTVMVLNVKLHWNTDFGIPEEGKTVTEALQLDSAQKWIAEHKNIVYPESSHIWLASEPLRNSAVEYRLIRNYEGHLITLDGIHRLAVWAHLGKQTTLAFIAGKVEGKIV
jgi:hypothetical protein